jgi:hypothetical protein
MFYLLCKNICHQIHFANADASFDSDKICQTLPNFKRAVSIRCQSNIIYLSFQNVKWNSTTKIEFKSFNQMKVYNGKKKKLITKISRVILNVRHFKLKWKKIRVVIISLTKFHFTLVIWGLFLFGISVLSKQYIES